MKKKFFLPSETLGDLLKNIGITVGTLSLIAIGYFYVYLPNVTNHGDGVTVPDLLGMPSERLDSLVTAFDLRFEINDSSYSEDYKPLDVIRQFPRAGSIVKPGRKIFVSINRVDPPTVPLPAIVEVSLINAMATLKSNELKLGRIFYQPSPFSDLVLEMRVNETKIEPGTRVPKGTVVDLIVGDGAGPMDMTVRNLLGMTLEDAQTLLSELNLHLGNVTVPADADTTGISIIVFRQKPEAGDSVRVGDPINLWLAEPGYVPKDSVETDINN
jgi:eukaryotic-like serine/threonine-protein kinase